MVIPKPPKDFCVDDFIYKEYVKNGWEGPEYKTPVIIKHCRIDRGAEYTTRTNGKQLLYNAVIFCYKGITAPLPEFKTQSVIVYDGIEHTVTKVIPIYEAYENKIYSYELEVV